MVAVIPPSYGPQNMHLTVSKRSAAIKVKLRNCKGGFMIGESHILQNHDQVVVNLYEYREKSLKSRFEKGGPNGTGMYRAVLITGPPGIGKTTSAHLVSRLEGFNPIELNASDARNKRLVEVQSIPAPFSSRTNSDSRIARTS